jgi:hypothetical protein
VSYESPDEKRARIAAEMRARQQRPPKPDPKQELLRVTPPVGAVYPIVRWTERQP